MMRVTINQDSTVYVPDFIWFSKGAENGVRITDWVEENLDTCEFEDDPDYEAELLTDNYEHNYDGDNHE